MERMDKQSLINLINTLEIDREEFWILSSGALTLRGIYPNAGDLDIAVTNKGLEQLKSKFDLVEKENGWYIVNEKIECVCDGDKNDLEYQPELVEGIYLQNIHEYLRYLKESSRQKDKDRINLVEKYINLKEQIEH